MVVSWIKLTIAPDLSSSLSHHKVAHDLWMHIQKRFSVTNRHQVQRIKNELANCHQKGSAVEAYYGNLTKLKTSLADFERKKNAEEIAKEREEDKLHQFLMGLDENLFGSVKSSLLSRDPLPSLDEDYQVVVQDEESKRSSSMIEECPEAASFAVQTASSGPRQRHQAELRDPSALCTLCGRTGHLPQNCFRKIGYPIWWGIQYCEPHSNTQHDHRTSSGSSNSAPTHSALTNSSTTRRPEQAQANQVLATTLVSSAI